MGTGIEVYRDGDFEGSNPPYFSTDSGFILGSQSITNSGSITDANFANGEPFWYVDSLQQGRVPVFSIAGNTLSWSNSVIDPGSFSGTLYWGIK